MESPASFVQGNSMNNSVKQLSKMRNGIKKEKSCRYPGDDSACVSGVNTTTLFSRNWFKLMVVKGNTGLLKWEKALQTVMGETG